MSPTASPAGDVPEPTVDVRWICALCGQVEYRVVPEAEVVAALQLARADHARHIRERHPDAVL